MMETIRRSEACYVLYHTTGYDRYDRKFCSER